MFVVETDIVYAVMKRRDELKGVAKLIFGKSRKLFSSSVALVEVLSVLKALGRFEAVAPKIKALGDLVNLEFLPLTPEMAEKAAGLHIEGRLTFFDSFYAATALVLGGTLVSSDEAFRDVPGLKYMHIQECVSDVLGVRTT
ncbi:MAG: type II toxin-antitoxin system VapC family toxin [Candidatus Geothermarchaeales archaeon]